jgi:plasmid stabilization system protein ParE
MAPRAQGELRRAVAWWRANRRENPKLLVAELKEAGARLTVAPEAGVLADDVEPRVRKLLLPRTQYYVYYEVDHEDRTVSILSIWRTTRGRPPRL